MKKIKIAIIPLLVQLFIPNTVSANDGNILYYYTKSSMTPTKISLDDLDKMTFNDNGIQMWKQNGSNQIPFEDFLLFTFKEIEHPYITAVESPISPQNIRISYNNNQKTLVLVSDTPLSGVCIYDLQGRIIISNNTIDSNYSISLSSAPVGVYFVKVKCGSKVIIKKIIL